MVPFYFIRVLHASNETFQALLFSVIDLNTLICINDVIYLPLK